MLQTRPLLRSRLGLISAAVLLFGVTADVSLAQHSHRRNCDCGPTYMAPKTVLPPSVEPSVEEAMPSEGDETLPPVMAEPEIDLSPDVGSSSFGLASAEQSPMPNMIGDFYYRGGSVLIGIPLSSSESAGLPPIGGPRFKIAEQNAALPTDRVFASFHHYENSILVQSLDGSVEGLNLQRYSVGAEKTFFDGAMSAEIRVPFLTLDSGEFTEIAGDGIGNLQVNLKGLLVNRENLTVSTGLGLSLPTGEDFDTTVFAESVRLETQAVNLMPFVFMSTNLSDPLFFQASAQVDVPLNGNSVIIDGEDVGTLNEQTFLYLDTSLGYWVYRNRCSSGLTGVAGLLELHYSGTLNDADLITPAVTAATIGNRANQLDIVVLTYGVHLEVARSAQITVAGAFPINDDGPDPFLDGENPFDHEIIVQMDYRF